MRHATFATACLLLAPAIGQTQQAQQPIRSGVELVRIDVQVSSRNGLPAENLRPDQFEVSIDGKRLPVATLDFVRYNAGPAEGTASPGATAPSATPAGAPSTEPRVIVLAVDEPSFMLASRQAPIEVVKRIAAMANPRDYIGLLSFPGGVVFSPSLDRAGLVDAALKITGRLSIRSHNRLQFSVADAVDWAAEPSYRERIYQRECPNPNDQACRREVDMMANELIGTFQMQGSMSVNGLMGAVEMVKSIPGRKTMIVVSGGFVANDRMAAIGSGSRSGPDVRFEADMIGRRAAEANTVIYSLHTEVAFLNAFRDSSLMAGGLERFTASAGGTLIPVPMSPDKALARVLSETSAYYLLGVEPPAELRDGKTHRIAVRVKQSGTQVRSRSSVMIPKS